MRLKKNTEEDDIETYHHRHTWLLMRFFHICNIWSGETVAKVTKAKIQTPDWEHGCAITQNLQLCETEIIMHNKLKIQLNLWPLQWGHLVTLFSCLHAGMVWETHISTVLSDCLHPMIKHHKFQGAHFPHPSQSPNDLIFMKTSLDIRSLQFAAHLNT